MTPQEIYTALDNLITTCPFRFGIAFFYIAFYSMFWHYWKYHRKEIVEDLEWHD